MGGESVQVFSNRDEVNTVDSKVEQPLQNMQIINLKSSLIVTTVLVLEALCMCI